jgi:hypothetical protein
MKTTTQGAILAMWVSLVLTMTSAQAALTANGLLLNGMPMNGVALNGIPRNGTPLNGLTLQVLPPAESSPVGPHESVPFHRVSHSALGATPPSRLGLPSLCSRFRLVPLCL